MAHNLQATTNNYSSISCVGDVIVLQDLHVILAWFSYPFALHVDAEYVLGTAHQERGTEKGTTMDDRGKTVEDKAGASAEKSMEGDKATGVEDMQVDRQNPLPPLPQFGRKAPRTPRVPVQAAPQLPDSDGSAESVRSTSSERSDESMSRTDPDDSDYDPKTPSEATQ